MISFALIVVFLVLLVGAAGELDALTKYVIRKGKHYYSSIDRVRCLVFKSELKFVATFDTSCLYQSTSDDINKLYGFTDYNSSVHQNSLRIGWKPNYQNQIEVYAYWYCNGKRGHQLLGISLLNEANIYTLRILDHHYYFAFNNFSIYAARCKQNRFGIKWRLFPYFGGDEAAPHDIKIFIKEI